MRKLRSFCLFFKMELIIVLVLTVSRRSLISWIMKPLLIMSLWVLQQTFTTRPILRKAHFKIPWKTRDNFFFLLNLYPNVYFLVSYLLLYVSWLQIKCCYVKQRHLIDHLKDLQKSPQLFRLILVYFIETNPVYKLSRCFAK